MRIPDPNVIFPNEYKTSCFLKNVITTPNIHVGDYTYYDDADDPVGFEKNNVLFNDPEFGEQLIIGRFCQIASGVKFIMGPANHRLSSVTAYPFSVFGGAWTENTPPHLSQLPHKGDTVVGNDVWIGRESVVMPGVKIGDGAIIAAYSVVARDVPAYTVYGGNPARLLKNRFEAELTDLLLRFRWWELPPEALAETLPLLCDSNLERVKQTLGNRLAGLTLRNERPEDWDAVELLIRDAFWNEHVPGASEPYLAHRMRRHPDFVPELSMVAELDGKLVGSILYTVSTLTAEDGTVKKCLTFGPIAVHPDDQRRGVGRALIEKTFEKARDMGYESVVIFGHPSNYVARGFVSGLRVNVCVGDGYFPTALLVKPLTDNAFDGRRWRFSESPACEIDEHEAEEYDKRFPPREKKTLPCQEEFFIYSHSSMHP